MMMQPHQEVTFMQLHNASRSHKLPGPKLADAQIVIQQ